MALAGAAAAAGDADGLYVAAERAHLRGAFATGFEVHGQWPGAVERGKRTDPITDTREENAEIGAFDDATVVLEFSRRKEVNTDASGRVRARIQRDLRWSELLYAAHFGAAAAGPDSLAADLTERASEVLRRLRIEQEEMEIEPERCARFNGEPVQEAGAEDEGARPVRESAGAGPESRGLKDACVGARLAPVAGPGSGAVRNADDAAEHRAQCSAQHVPGLACGEVDTVARDKGKTKPAKLEDHPAAVQPA
jgi:hypothetical protein